MINFGALLATGKKNIYIYNELRMEISNSYTERDGSG